MDIDVVATEHGVADLRGLGHEARDRALIAIAAPPDRSMLEDRWCAYAGRF
jgi:acyl-CoA hydrolase